MKYNPHRRVLRSRPPTYVSFGVRRVGPVEDLLALLRGVVWALLPGAPPLSPMDIVIEGGRIAAIEKVGLPRKLAPDGRRPSGSF